jgi:hypothetical protein
MEVIPSGGTDRYSLTMADGAAAANGGLGDLTIWPQITYTAVPEPTSLALLLVAGLFAGSALTQRRR